MGKRIIKPWNWFLALTGSVLDARELWGIFAGSSIMGVIISAIVSFIRELPIPLLVIFCIGLIIAFFVGISYIYSFIKRKRSVSSKTKSAIGGLIGKSSGGRVSNSYYKGKIIIRGKSQEVDVGGLIGQSENTEVVDSSADAEIEYKQD